LLISTWGQLAENGISADRSRHKQCKYKAPDKKRRNKFDKLRAILHVPDCRSSNLLRPPRNKTAPNVAVLIRLPFMIISNQYALIIIVIWKKAIPPEKENSTLFPVGFNSLMYQTFCRTGPPEVVYSK